jgi:membrane associated rhomboid family serine protease
MIRLTDVVKNLLIINAIVFLSTKFLLAVLDVDKYFTLFTIESGSFQPYQIVTHMFNHFDFRHVIFNSIALVFIGPLVEQSLGPKRFLFLYLSAGILSGILSAFISPFPMMGSSGAIYGMMVAMALMYPDLKMMIFPIPFGVKAIYLVGFYLVYDIVSGMGGFGNMVRFANLGGAAIGAFLVFYWGLSNVRLK